MNSIFKPLKAVLCLIRNQGNPTKPISFVEVKELNDSAYAAIDDLKKHNLLILKANRLQERYLSQLPNTQARLAGAL